MVLKPKISYQNVSLKVRSSEQGIWCVFSTSMCSYSHCLSQWKYSPFYDYYLFLPFTFRWVILSWIHCALSIPMTYVFKSNKYDKPCILFVLKKKTQSYFSLLILCSLQLNMERVCLHKEIISSMKDIDI